MATSTSIMNNKSLSDYLRGQDVCNLFLFFGEEDYGFMMENYGHGGRTSPEGEGMGEFTIYDWGNGAAAEAYNRILDKFGNLNN